MGFFYFLRVGFGGKMRRRDTNWMVGTSMFLNSFFPFIFKLLFLLQTLESLTIL